MEEDTKKFGLLRSILWPIHRTETKKTLSLLLLFFLLCICYSILRNLKDTLVLTANTAGAEVIPFIKVWGMLPAAIIGTWGYTQLTARFRRDKVFYIILSSFLVFFLLFAFLLYPNSEKLVFSRAATFLGAILPKGCQGLIGMIANWSLTLFYVISELWSVLVLSVLFWGFANDATGVSEAKRSYGILNIGSNIAPAIAASLTAMASHAVIPTAVDHWKETLINLILLVAVLGTVAMLLYRWIYAQGFLLPENRARSAHPEKQERLSLRASIRYLLNSKYLTCLALIVLGYNISINLSDILWKDRLKAFFSNPNDMLQHMNLVTAGVGIIATQGAIFFSILVRRMGWTFVALLTPLVMTVMASLFFTFLFCGDILAGISLSLVGLSPLAMTVYCGSIQNCLSKAGKYSVFDASKEIAFLPLNTESKQRGKAAIDGLGSGVGKSGSSLIYQGLFIATGSISLAMPYIAVILTMIFFTWIAAVLNLGKLFKKVSQEEVTPEPSSESSSEEPELV